MSRRRLQGAPLVAGAIVLYLLVEAGDARFHWTPLVLGLAYLAAAAMGGPRGSYWATATVITAWGAGVALLAEADTGIATAPGYLLAIGAGALVAALLERRGFAVDALGVACAVLLAGAFFALQPHEPFRDAWLYAAAVALVGVIRLAVPRTDARTGSTARSGSASG